MKDFDIAKYLREHQLGSYGILNHYVDLKPLKEEEVTEDVTPEEVAEIPYEGPDHKLTGLGDSDEFEQADTVSEEELEEADANKMYAAIDYLRAQGFSDEDIKKLPDYISLYDDYMSSSLSEMGKQWHPHLTVDPDEVVDAAIKDLKKARLSMSQIKQAMDKGLARHSVGDDMPLE